MPERREPKRKPREVELFDYPNADHPKYATESGELFSPEEDEGD